MKFSQFFLRLFHWFTQKSSRDSQLPPLVGVSASAAGVDIAGELIAPADDPQGQMERAMQFWLAGNWDGITSMFESGDVTRVSEPRMCALVGVAFLQKGHELDGRQWISRAVETGIDRAQLTALILAGAQNSLGNAFALCGRLNEAKVHWSASLKGAGDVEVSAALIESRSSRLFDGTLDALDSRVENER